MRKSFTKLIFTMLVTWFCFLSAEAVTYYSTGNVAANTLANWKANRDGTGTSPANFTSGDVFIVQGTGGGAGAPHSMTTSSTISISGTNSKLWIESGATLTASNNITLATATVFQMDDNATFNHNNTGAFATTILQGVEDFATNSNFVIQNSTGTGPGTPSNGGFGNLIISSTTYSSSVNSSGALTSIKGNFRIISTGSGTNEFRLTGATGLTLNIGGNLIIEGGILNLGNGTASPIVNLSGNFHMSGGTLTFLGTTNPSSATINLIKSGVQTFSKSGGTLTAANSSGRKLVFNIANGTTLDMGTNILDCATGNNVDFTVNSGATVRFGAPGGIVAQGTSATTGNIQTSSTSIRSFSTGANYEYTGTASQVTGTGLPSSVAGLRINNSEGVTLTNPTTVTGKLTLTNGKLTSTPTNLLTLGSAATVSGGSSSSFVLGPVASVVASASSTAKTFPIGNGSNYSPVVLTVTQDAATSTTYTAEAKSGDAAHTSPSSISGVSTSRYYTITKGSGANVTAGQVQLVYDANDATGISVANKDIIRIVKDDGAGNWIDLGPDEGGTANNSGTVTSSVNFTSFSDFAIANAVQGTIPETKTVSGTAAICPGGSTNVTLGSSQTGVTYDLYKNGVAQNDTKLGDGNDLVWSVSATGTYTVKTTSDGGYAVTLMDGSAVITAKAAPAITGSSLAGNTYPQNGTASALSVTATGNGLSYQWYKSNDNSNSTTVDDVTVGTNNSYTPSTTEMGTSYYYCVVSGDCTPSATSSVSGAIIVVEACTNPTFTVQPTDNLNVCIDDTPVSLGTVAADQSPTYQWYSNTSKSNSGGSIIEGATNASYSPPTNAAGTFYYYVVATKSVCSTASDAVQFIVYPATAIQNQSTAGATYSKNVTATSLTVTAVGKNLSYQWYSSTDAATNTVGDDVTVGTNSNSYTPSTATVGTLYYYCVVSGGCVPTTVTSNVSGAIVVVPYATGDYVVTTSGNWGTVGSWSTWNGTTLVAASVIPNANSVNVFVPNGKSINVETSGRSVKDLTVEGTLTSSASNGSLSYLYIYGDLTVNTGGFIGNAANPTGDYVDTNDKGYDGISFRFYGANSTIKGNGGNIYVGRMLTATEGMTLTIDRDMTAVYHGTSNQGGHTIAVYHNGIDNTSITINAGKTLTFAPWACLGTTSSSNGLPAFNFTVNVNGTLELKDTPFPNTLTPSTIRSMIYGGTGSGKTFTLNIGSTGVVNTPQFYPNGTVSGGGIPTGSNSVINIASGGVLNVSQILDLRQVNQTITGSGTFNLQDGATLRIGNTAGINGQILSTSPSLSSSANYQFEGTSAQVTGSLLPSTINNMLISNAAGVTINTDLTANTVTVNPGSKLTIAEGKTLTVSNNTLKLLSSETAGTATVLGNVSGNAEVEQNLSAVRNWYMSSPVETGIMPAGGYWYNEALASGNWQTGTSGDAMTVGRGYIVLPSASGNVSFSGALNNGDISIALTRTDANTTYKGFNLVGNPYPSFLNAVTLLSENSGAVEGNIWYRTANWNNDLGKFIYQFQTYNSISDINVPKASNGSYVPPMQGFWVRAKSDGVNLDFTNTMRKHNDSTVVIKLRAPKALLSDRQLVRLQVSNGSLSDEMVIYSDANASNSYDAYDSPKMMNSSSSSAAINMFTTVGSENLVIDGRNTLPLDVTIPVSFATNAFASGSYTISANELTNIPSSVTVKIIDNGVETSLSEGGTYTFTAAAGTTKTLGLILRSPGTVTGVENGNADYLNVYANGNRQIMVNAPAATLVNVFNATGQRIASKNMSGTSLQIDVPAPGVYMVSVGGKTFKIVAP